MSALCPCGCGHVLGFIVDKLGRTRRLLFASKRCAKRLWKRRADAAKRGEVNHQGENAHHAWQWRNVNKALEIPTCCVQCRPITDADGHALDWCPVHGTHYVAPRLATA